MTKLNIDIKDEKFREWLRKWFKIINDRLKRGQVYEDPRYGTIVLTRREFLKLLATIGIAGALATLGIGMFNAHWLWAQETTNPPPTPAQYNYGELNWLELTVRGTPLGEGLVAEYLLWEGTGNILHDTSGYMRNISNPCSWGVLPNGKFYIIFDGTKAINTYKSLERMGISTEYTFEFIYKRTGYSPDWTEVWVINPSVYYHDFIANPTGDIHYYQFYDGNWHRIYVSIPLNRWKHILFRARSNDNAELYVNNILINRINTNALGGFYNAWYIGGDWGHKQYYVRMYLALIRIFKCKISDQVRNQLFMIAKIMVPYIS